MSSADTKSVRAVERAIDVLTSFDAEHTTLEIGELQRATGLTRPTLYRLLLTLEAKGFIHSHGSPLRFELGPAVHKLAHAWDRSFPVVSVSRPLLEELWRATGETVALMLASSPSERTCAIELKSPHPISFSRGSGYSDPMHRGASGKAILAFQTPEAQAKVLAQLETARQRDDLSIELARIRRNGYALTSAELVDGVCAIAAPVVDPDGRVNASVCLFGPHHRMQGRHLKDCVRKVVAASAAVRKRLGSDADGTPRHGR